MRSLVLVCLLVACGDDDGGGGGGSPDGRVDSSPGAADARADSAPAIDAPVVPDSRPIDGVASQAPVITRVAWTHETPCVGSNAGDVTVVTTVSDADTSAGALVFSGAVSGCTGVIDSDNATLVCPNIAPYSGMVVVTDPEANSDTQAITIAPCTDGMAP